MKIVAVMRKRTYRRQPQRGVAFLRYGTISASKKSLRRSKSARTRPGHGGAGCEEQGMFDPARLVFIDETSTNTAPCGFEAAARAASIRSISVPALGIEQRSPSSPACAARATAAPFVLDGSMNATSFMAYLKRCSAPQPQARRYRDAG